MEFLNNVLEKRLHLIGLAFSPFILRHFRPTATKEG